MKNITENLSDSIAFKLCESKDRKSDEFEVLKYGVFAFLHICMAAILTILFGVISNTLFQISIISLMAGLMKRNSGGIHCSGPNRCIVTGIIISYIFALIGKSLINIEAPILYSIDIAMLIHSFIVIYTKCPVPSENKPLKKESTRRKLRKNALFIYFISVILFVINLMLASLDISYNFNNFVLCIILGIYMQILSLTTLGSRFILFIDKVLVKIKI